jgi:hypothetical protein
MALLMMDGFLLGHSHFLHEVVVVIVVQFELRAACTEEVGELFVRWLRGGTAEHDL